MLQKQQHVAKVASRRTAVKGEYNEICSTQTRFAGSSRYAWSVLAFNLAVVLWGAFVRATGAGAGCGKHWPLCNGEMLPRSPSLNTIIEFTHRVTSGIDLALVAVLVCGHSGHFRESHAVRLGATLSAIFLMTEALLGAALVLLEHVARNQSSARAYSLSAHLVNTLTLLGCLTLTAWWTRGKAPVRVGGSAAWKAAISLGAVMILGVSGAIAALGDTLFPSLSLAEGWVRDFRPGGQHFRPAAHPPPGDCGTRRSVAGLLCRGRGGTAAGPSATRLDVLGMVWCRLRRGRPTCCLSAPVWMQLVHLLLADAMWISLVLLCAGTLEPGGVLADKTM